jgi:hypothetical protein
MSLAVESAYVEIPVLLRLAGFLAAAAETLLDVLETFVVPAGALAALEDDVEPAEDLEDGFELPSCFPFPEAEPKDSNGAAESASRTTNSPGAPGRLGRWFIPTIGRCCPYEDSDNQQIVRNAQKPWQAESRSACCPMRQPQYYEKKVNLRNRAQRLRLRRW